jgi:AcrR family transcriptional regulator
MTTEVAHPAQERRRYKPEETRARILKAAHELFGSRGYVATSTADIAAQAGVAEGSIFYHFGSKAALMTALGARFGEAMVAAMRGDATGPAQLEPGQMIARAFAHAHASGLLRQRVGLTPDDPAAQPLMAAARDVSVRFIEQVMQARGPDRLPAGMDIPTAASLAYAAVHDALERLQAGEINTPRAVVEAECIRFVRAACGYDTGDPS